MKNSQTAQYGVKMALKYAGRRSRKLHIHSADGQESECRGASTVWRKVSVRESASRYADGESGDSCHFALSRARLRHFHHPAWC